ncbi:hypothetical protein D3C72_1875570 [compost metagenome]
MPSGESMPRPPAKGLPPLAVWQAIQSPARDRYSPCLIICASFDAGVPSAANAALATRAEKAATMVCLIIVPSP